MPSRGSEGFVPLRDYALLSDMRSTALVATDGRIDWWAAPVMDSPPVCAAILDPPGGGSVSLAPAAGFEVERRYRPGTMVLETVYRTAGGTVRVTDSLNLGSIGLLPWVELARLVTVESGEVEMRWCVAPGHRLHATQPWTYLRAGLPVAVNGDQHLAVVADGAGEPVLSDRQVSGRFTLGEGSSAVLAIAATEGEPIFPPSPAAVRERVESTAARWQKWSERIGYEGPHRDAVIRSSLVIKALTLQPSGGIAAAATTSLPEAIGGSRNFDYRFAWIRDGAFALDAVGRLGLEEELHAGASWLLGAAAKQAPDLRVFYSLRGEVVPAEMGEADVAGYRFSRPVHLGNSAASQKQLGAYGDMIDAIWRYTENGGRLDAASGTMIASLLDQVCDKWRQPDAGLWELGDYQHYTSSKIGCWTALDRGVRLSEAGQLASLHVDRWRAEGEAIQRWVRRNCWSTTKQSLTFYSGTEDLDAAVFLAARTRFCKPDDPVLHTTIDAVRSELTAEGPLLYRYSGVRGKEGAFIACSCWLVEALAHAGRADEARELLEALWARANDVGLLTEEMDPVSGEFLGNIPQALSHLAVIGAATALS